MKRMLKNFVCVCVALSFLVALTSAQQRSEQEKLPYPIVDTGQTICYDNSREIKPPRFGESFYGQVSKRNEPQYHDNGDGTITDLVTGLMWQKGFEVLSLDEAREKLKTFRLAGHDDWRIPTVKELYSLMLFSGIEPSLESRDAQKPQPFIDTRFFDFAYGVNGSRPIDTQGLTSTIYAGFTMGRSETMFGVNFADGRIKGYPVQDRRAGIGKKFYARFVRGNREYGKNHFRDNSDGTITDEATGLCWSQADSKKPMNWEDAFAYVQKLNTQKYLGYDDWRLPHAKELQSLVDYTRSPQKTETAAIDPLFRCTEIKDEAGKKNFGYYWTSTTHNRIHSSNAAVYIAFGEALGKMAIPPSSPPKVMDVHGAGAQRSDPKTGEPTFRGPQGDVVRVKNFVRPVRVGVVN